MIKSIAVRQHNTYRQGELQSVAGSAAAARPDIKM